MNGIANQKAALSHMPLVFCKAQRDKPSQQGAFWAHFVQNVELVGAVFDKGGLGVLLCDAPGNLERSWSVSEGDSQDKH